MPFSAQQAATPPPGSCDLLDVPLTAGLLALARMDLRGRPTGAVWTLGGRLLLPLPPGAGEELPGLLHWLGWGHLHGVLRNTPAGTAAGALRLRPGGTPSPEPVVRLLDTCADACARLQLLLSPRSGLSRAPSRRLP
ncbi:hypothetical protein [Streptacidiphilus jiangxiensis]|uniref:Uncharacterized protein n=1 Tax=Streptacidiphilus jiangxiensis TaxID=235985 RepID=A0A1H7Q2Y5_STRJI|nr:hypothetical protein [Streptacidiphilus jiangxiensis]SEL41677.1 hypothetical protein SAMN05414137_108230 [Streptacidiphilus jiangxiensis]